VQNRRAWIDARRKERRRQGKQRTSTERDDIDDGVESQIFAAWEKHVRMSQPVSNKQLLNALLVFSLISRFMTISAKFMDAIDQRTNEHWIQISLRLLVRASLETLRLQSRGCDVKTLPSLEECFAWGYTSSITATNGGNQDVDNKTEDAKLSEMVNDLFRHTNGRENPSWTEARLETLNEFFIDQDTSDFYKTCRLERLADKYPLEDFLVEVTDLIRSIWQTSCEQIFDRPVLQQIEEGHIESCGIRAGDEFEEFCDRAGLSHV
jgi:hypothetical protein